MKIAILMTCYNRAGTTLKCLDHLFACELPEEIEFDVWLVDDASSDGTGEKVKIVYPSVHVIQGTGKLFWCGGMRLAWDTAAQANEYDVFLWLNDDTFLFSNALRVFVQAATDAKAISGAHGIIVGATCDPDTRITTYGFTSGSPRCPDGSLLPLTNETINGNAVWIAKDIWHLIGGLRSCFTHAMGDTDYGARALKMDIPVWLTPEHIGTCPMNQGPRWDDPHLSLSKRWKLLHSYKGCPPLEYMQMVRVTRPLSWPKYVLKLYWRVLFAHTPAD